MGESRWNPFNVGYMKRVLIDAEAVTFENLRETGENLTVVGHGCMPDDKCFCHSLGTSNAYDGFDLFLNPVDGRYLVTVASARGDDIVQANAALFQPATRQDTRDYLQRLRTRTEAFRLSLDTTDLPYVLELKKDDPVWDELGKKCLCCGSCSMVCPTCACFNVMDEIPVEGKACREEGWWVTPRRRERAPSRLSEQGS